MLSYSILTDLDNLLRNNDKLALGKGQKHLNKLRDQWIEQNLLDLTRKPHL
jgi:hypothetical protein